MQWITTVAKKAAKNMSSAKDYTPFVFRYQFFEDFLALLLYMRRDYKEWLFWVFLSYQVCLVIQCIDEFRPFSQSFVIQEI